MLDIEQIIKDGEWTNPEVIAKRREKLIKLAERIAAYRKSTTPEQRRQHALERLKK